MLVLAAEAPKITDWMQGWGNVLGVLMSTIAVIFTGLLFRHEIRVRREEKADGDMAQARLVVGTVSDFELGPDGTLTQLEYSITNYSDAPVFFVNPVIYHYDTDDDFDSERVHHVLRPGAIARYRVAVELADPPELQEDDSPDLSQFAVRFVFIDKNGLEWRKEGYDAPERGFKAPEPTWSQRAGQAISDRLRRLKIKMKYGPWSSATRRRRRVAAKLRRDASPAVDQKSVGPPLDEA